MGYRTQNQVQRAQRGMVIVQGYACGTCTRLVSRMHYLLSDLLVFAAAVSTVPVRHAQSFMFVSTRA